VDYSAGLAQATQRVAIINSSTRAEYQQASRIISAELSLADPGLSVEELVLESGNGQEEDFWRRLSRSKPDLVVTIGSESSQSARTHAADLPVIFTMVLDKLSKNQSDNDPRDFNGVTLAIPVDQQFEYIKKVLPDARRVGFIYGSKLEEVFSEASAAAQKLGIRLVAEKIASERDIPESLRRILPGIDAYWMPLDPMFFEEIVFRFVLRECYKNSVPIFSVYQHVVQAGIPIALGVDYEDISRQTAEIALRRLKGGRLSTPVVEHPRKLILYVNEGVASSLNLRIPELIARQAVIIRSGS
jgi:putative ABC transport system substrate-binding protein